MAKKKRQATPPPADSRKKRAQKKSSVPADSCPPRAGESRAGSRQRGPKQVSARNEDSNKSLADSFQSPATFQSAGPIRNEMTTRQGGASRNTASNGVGQPAFSQPLSGPLTSIRHKRLSILQKILVSCIVLMVAILLYALLRGTATRPPQANKSLSTPTSIPALLSTGQEKSTREQIPTLQGPARPALEAGTGPPEGLSLRVAETFYLQKDFNRAYAVFNQLRQGLPAGQEDPLRDFLQLKMAFCMKNAGDFDQAGQILRMVSQSRYPVVRTVANYHLSLLEMQQGQYLNARRRAYQTMALISALTFDWQWTLSLQRNCRFLIAESVTRHILSLCDTDKDCPAELWTDTSEADPFINLSEAELRRLLNGGCEQLRGALLSPQIQSAAGAGRPGGPARWIVSCNGASIEELLARFAAHADLDIQWACDSAEGGLEAEKAPFRKRAVSLYMSAATTQQFLTVAAGGVSLLARLDENGTVKIFNPSDYASLSQHIALLSQEAISLWRRFLLTFGDDESTYGGANAHFALGLLQGRAAGEPEKPAAIAEFKLVANRYPRTSVAPYALLASSKLKVDLQDYLGAREDLKLLTEQYPDTEFSNQALLHLADATMKAGLLSEAAQLYRKVYNLGFSSQSQRVSALGAGRCFYEQACQKASAGGGQQDYENAAKWLTQYINLGSRPRLRGDKLVHAEAGDGDTDRDFYLACLLLGKTYLAQDLPQKACDAFELALSGQLLVQEYVETISALVKAHLKLGQFVEALKLLENTSSWQFSQKESIEILLLKASVLRSMGLADEAMAVLGDKAEYVLDSQLKAKIFFERAKCSIAKGNLELARKNLSEILVLVEPSVTGGPAHEVGCELADVCLKLGQDPQAISICLQILASEPQAPIKQRALNLLATAYRRQKNYDQAALALLGQPRSSIVHHPSSDEPRRTNDEGRETRDESP